MEYFRPDVKVGGLLFMTLVLVIVAALTVGNVGGWLAAKQRYTVLFRNTNLLSEGSRVSYAGFPVGQVTDIAMRPAELRRQYPDYPVAVTITIRASVLLRQDSRVEMKTDGMIGDRYVDILPGAGEPIPSGGTVLGTMGGIEQLLSDTGGLQDGVQSLLAALQTLLTDASQPGSIPTMVVKVTDLIDTVSPRLSPLATDANELVLQLRQEVASTSQMAQRLLQDVDAVLAENRNGVRDLVPKLHATVDETHRTMLAAKALLETSQRGVPALLNDMRDLLEGVQESRKFMVAQTEKLLTDLDAMVVENDRNLFITLENLRKLSDHLEAAAAQVRANPAVLIWGRRGEDRTETLPATGPSPQLLQDRGRMGRYDRVQ
jgi:phospholipid/cholesterol/gamma-HCH transport system substrate-binding protein